MIYEVTETIRVRTPKGDTDLMVGQLMNIDPSKALRLVETGKLKPHLTEARKDSLVICMDAVWDTEAMPYYRRGFMMAPAILKAETDVERLQAEVVQGKASLEKYRNAVQELISTIKQSF